MRKRLRVGVKGKVAWWRLRHKEARIVGGGLKKKIGKKKTPYLKRKRQDVRKREHLA